MNKGIYIDLGETRGSEERIERDECRGRDNGILLSNWNQRKRHAMAARRGVDGKSEATAAEAGRTAKLPSFRCLL